MSYNKKDDDDEEFDLSRVKNLTSIDDYKYSNAKNEEFNMNRIQRLPSIYEDMEYSNADDDEFDFNRLNKLEKIDGFTERDISKKEDSTSSTSTTNNIKTTNVEKTNTPTMTRKVYKPDDLSKTQFSLATRKETQNAKELTDNKNLPQKIGKWFKDLGASAIVNIKSTGRGIGATIKEGINERKQAVNNMSDDEIEQSFNNIITGEQGNTSTLKIADPDTYNKLNSITKDHKGLQKTTIVIDDLLNDILREKTNGVIDIANNIADFFSRK